MELDVIPRVLRGAEVARLLQHHRDHHGLASLAPPEEQGVPVLRGEQRVASLQATGPRDAVEGLALALSVILDLQEHAQRHYAALGRRLGHLTRRLEQQGDFESLKEQTADLIRINRRLVAAATTDPLTGLFNRRAIEARMHELEETAVEQPAPVAVIMADIDHFKRVNDTRGHLVGDAVLAQVAELMRGRCRQADAVGRWGGEEFVVLLPGCDLDCAVTIAEDLRARIRQYPFHVSGGAFQVTVSFGVAAGEVIEMGDTIALLQRADSALYAAKQAGRDRVVAAAREILAVAG
jgi:diguanylate cyclase (GGDEF)-like protein